MKKEWWIYGLITGAVLLLVQIVQYKTMVRDLSQELFGGIIAVVFLVLGVWFSRSFSSRSKGENSFKLKELDAYSLSEREKEVLLLLGKGLSNQEIADDLFVSLNTIKTHLSNIYQKMGVSRRTQAIQKAMELSDDTSPESVKRPNHPKV